MIGGEVATLVAGPFEGFLATRQYSPYRRWCSVMAECWRLEQTFSTWVLSVLFGGYAFFRFLSYGKDVKRQFLRNAFVAVWVSVIAAAVSFEIALSEPNRSIVLPAMALTHIVIGCAEGMITALIL